jgi:hypothetical protein
MAAQEDTSLLTGPGQITVTAAADSSESTTLLVSEGACLLRVLQEAFDDGARRPPPLELLAQALHSMAWTRIAGHARAGEIPVSKLSNRNGPRAGRSGQRAEPAVARIDLLCNEFTGGSRAFHLS